MGIRYSLHYLPKEKLIEFYKIHWADWVADPPEWFDSDFRAMIPRELLVEVPPTIWEVQEEAEKTEGSATGPWAGVAEEVDDAGTGVGAGVEEGGGEGGKLAEEGVP